MQFYSTKSFHERTNFNIKNIKIKMTYLGADYYRTTEIDRHISTQIWRRDWKFSVFVGPNEIVFFFIHAPEKNWKGLKNTNLHPPPITHTISRFRFVFWMKAWMKKWHNLFHWYHFEIAHLICSLWKSFFQSECRNEIENNSYWMMWNALATNAKSNRFADWNYIHRRFSSIRNSSQLLQHADNISNKMPA